MATLADFKDCLVITKDEYEELLDTSSRVDAMFAYMKGENYPDKEVICRILGRPDFVKHMKEERIWE